MPPTGFFIDANLLLLLIVGSVERDLVAKHRRLREKFTVEDFDRLNNLLDRVKQVFVTPNTLTETSNLLSQHRNPERSLFFDKLKCIIEVSKEVVVTSADASRNNAFKRLGLTDAALLEVATAETPLVTVDLELYLAAVEKGGQDTAVNFTHLQKL